MEIKQRNKATAVVLALGSLILLPGIGQLFAGRLARAFTLLGILVIVGLLGAAGGMDYPSGTFIIYAVWIVLYFYIAYDAYKLNANQNGVKLSWYNKWYFYILFAICFWLIAAINGALITTYRHFRIMNAVNAPTLQEGDTVMAKMNYGHQPGFFISSYTWPIIVLEAPKYTAGSFIVFSSPTDKKVLIRKIVAVAGETSTGKTGPSKVPEGNVLVSMDENTELVSTQDIQGKVLYILWSTQTSRTGTRVD